MKQQIPEQLNRAIQKEIEKLGFNVNSDSQKLARHILTLSDHFIQETARQSPLGDREMLAAYLAYYFPLNYLRSQTVIQEALARDFFKGLTSFIDIASGMGSLSLPLLQAFEWQRASCTDLAPRALQIQESLMAAMTPKVVPQFRTENWSNANEHYDLACFSYALNEFTETEKIIHKIKKYKAVLIIEASTSHHARNLMTLRENMIAEGFSATAPCTQQGRCPLLHTSKTDWCHHRIEVALPDWLNKIHKHLPMQNQTLTYSYLLLKNGESTSTGLTRVIGDALVEKGKTRQAICRNEEREFLAWFPQRMKYKDFSIARGKIVTLPENLEKKSNEVRVTDASASDLAD